MTEKFELDLEQFKITFIISSKAKKPETKIKFYLEFFNQFPDLINKNLSHDLNTLFWKIYPDNQHLFQLQDHAQKFVDIINHANFSTLPEKFQEVVKEDSVLYIHSAARIIFDFIFEITNQDCFLKIDNIINKINHILGFDDYIIPWYDYTQEKLEDIDFELNKMDAVDSDEKYTDYFKTLLEKNINFIHRTSDKLSLEDDFSLQKILASYYFKSKPEEQNLLPYILKNIFKETNTNLFEIHSFIPINEEFAINFIMTAHIENNEIIWGNKNHIFFNLIAQSLGAYFSKTNKDSNLFIRAINPSVNIMSYDKNMEKHEHKFNEIYGFFFSDKYAYGLTKAETKKILEQDLYTLQYKKPKPGTFYADASDLFAQYATDKALSLILGNIKIVHK